MTLHMSKKSNSTKSNSKKIWLINLIGSPCSPSSFNPDNSLAALAGSLKAAKYSPLILDYQTVSFCESLVPKTMTEELSYWIKKARSSKLSKEDFAALGEFDNKVMAHQFRILDAVVDSLFEKAQKENPLFIGFKLYSGEGSIFSRYVAKQLKSRLNIPMAAGGPLIRVVRQKYMELCDGFDYLLDGEADRSIVEFANYIAGREEINNVHGLIYKNEKNQIHQNPLDVITDLSSFPDPCYDSDVYPSLYESGEKVLIFQLDESRGCPNKCNFCVHPVINGQGFRVTPVEKIIEQIQNIQEKFGAIAFRLTGSNTPKKFLREFSETIMKKKINIKYSCFASINTTDVRIVEPLRESGLVGVFIGIESLDADILKNTFNKNGQNYQKVQSLIEAFLKSGVYTTTSWIYPMPNFTNKIRQEVKDFILNTYGKYSSEDGSVIVLPSLLVPSTEWFKNSKNYGFAIENEEIFYRNYIELVMKTYLPKQLMGSMGFTIQGKSFEEFAAESDSLSRELSQNNICLDLSDDWVLMSRLSGRSVEEFRTIILNNFSSGNYSEIKKMVKIVNNHQKWSEKNTHFKIPLAA